MSSPNEEQQKAILQEENAVVAAGAGSGKTFVLSERYAHLVIDLGYKVDEILTLTFTNKAASDMYQKIYFKLKEKLQENPDNIQLQQAISSFYTSKIQTLDSYCASIFRTSSRYYGIKPDFIIDNDQCVDFAYKEAIPFILNHRDNKALLELTKLTPIEQIAQEFFVNTVMYFTNIANPIDFNSLLDKQISIAKECFLKTSSKIDKLINEMFNILSQIPVTKKDSAGIINFRKLQEDSSNIEIPDIDRIILFYKQKGSNNKQIKELSEYINSLYNIYKFPSLRAKTAQEISEIQVEFKDAFDTLLSIISFICQYELTSQIFPLLQEFSIIFDNFKRSSGILTFSDITPLAVNTLINYPEIRKAEKKSIKAIMIDEFQDNNQIQRDLLFLLAEKYERMDKTIPSPKELISNKLFFVGDEKQSIYRFRDADVSVFRKLQEELYNEKTNTQSNLQLVTNYRSEPSLIASFNSIFGGFNYPETKKEFEQPTIRNLYQNAIFIQKSQITDFPLFEAAYNWVKPNLLDKENKPKDFSIEPNLQIMLNISNPIEEKSTNQLSSNNSDSEKENDNDNVSDFEKEAEWIAYQISFLMKTQNYKSSDFAILQRTTTKQHIYEKYLRILGIPYTSEAIVGFFGQTPINNLYYLLRLLVYPSDLVAYENVLYSPFVKLSIDGVNLCMMNILSNKDTVFSDSVINLLSPEDKEKYLLAQSTFIDLSEKANYFSVTELINELWYNKGYRFETIWNEIVSLYSELYDYLFEIARKTDNKGESLTDFVEILAELKEKNERLSDMDIPLEKIDAVSIMTIHKSKGLEFPVVFLPACNQPPKRDSGEKFFYYDKQYGISLKLDSPSWFPIAENNFFYNIQKKTSTFQEQAEIRRVLYVGMTRAKDKLYLSASIKPQKSISDKIYELLENSNQDNLISICKNIADYTQSHCTTKRDQLIPDYMIAKDTFWSYLLFTISSYATTEQKKKAYPFIINNLCLELENLKTQINQIDKTDFTSIDNVIQKVKLHYTQEKVLPPSPIVDTYLLPSKLHENIEKQKVTECITNNVTDSYPNIAKIISKYEDEKYENEKFMYTDFGTIAHAYAEAALTKTEPKINKKSYKKLNQQEITLITQDAEKMVSDFIHSDIGKKALQAEWLKCEFGIKLFVPKGTKIVNFLAENDQILNGQIDLVFKLNEEFIIVDYKTDFIENPEIHKEQLYSYKLVISNLYKTDISKIHTYLFYFRTNHCIEI